MIKNPVCTKFGYNRIGAHLTSDSTTRMLGTTFKRFRGRSERRVIPSGSVGRLKICLRMCSWSAKVGQWVSLAGLPRR